VQILVVVANVQARTLRTVVEQGFALMVIGRKLVGPKESGNPLLSGRSDLLILIYWVARFFKLIHKLITFPFRKGIRLIFLNQGQCCFLRNGNVS